MEEDNQLLRKPSVLSAILIICGASLILSAALIDALAELEYEGKTLAICLILGVTLSGGGLALRKFNKKIFLGGDFFLNIILLSLSVSIFTGECGLYLNGHGYDGANVLCGLYLALCAFIVVFTLCRGWTSAPSAALLLPCVAIGLTFEAVVVMREKELTPSK